MTAWQPHLVALALTGQLPAEALCRDDGDLVLLHLHGYGWTDVQIAEHTRWSAYTVGRKRRRLHLDANRPMKEAG